MNTVLSELPVDIIEACQAIEQRREAQAQSRLDRLAAVGRSLAAKRQEAVDARRASGIETIMMRCEEAYNGIDAANRHEFGQATWCKPLTMEGPVQRETGGASPRASILPNLTSRYVNVASAKVCEILLPPDDKAFSMSPTPMPELISALTDDTTLTHPHTGLPLQRDPTPEEMAGGQSAPGLSPPAASPLSATPPAQMLGGPSAPGDPTQAPGIPLKVKDLAQEKQQQADDAAEKAENRIFDWLVEGGYRTAAREVLLDAPKLGVGILKGPFPTVKRKMAVSKMQGPDGRPSLAIKLVEKITPSFKRVSPWNFYPDKNCGEKPFEGSYVFERDLISERSLRGLIGQPGYLESQLLQVLREGPNKKYLDAERPTFGIDDERYEIWHFQGLLKREDFEVFASDDVVTDQDWIPVVATLINDTVVKVAPHPLEVTGGFNYHIMPWQRRDGHWVGVGVAEQVFCAQRIVTQATRAMMDNAGHAAGPQIVIDAQAITPGPGASWELAPWKIWLKGAESTIDDVRKAFAAVEFPDRQAALMAIINYGFKLAEESTNIPLITQGQSGATSPDTLGQSELQNTNANQLLRAVGYQYDDGITEPLVQQCYEWLLLDPEIPDEEKGDFDVHAHGSTALVERAIQDQVIAQMANLVNNPAFGVDPKKWFGEYMKSKRLDPRRFQYTDEEQAKIESNPPPPPPQVQAAQIRAQVDQAKIQAQQASDAQELQLRQALGAQDLDRDRAYVEAETARTQAEHQARMQELALKRELALLDYANKHQIALEQVKSELAATTMKLRTQKELAAQDRAGQVLAPPTEPPGKAPPGQAYER